jgi:hypothetical protein
MPFPARRTFEYKPFQGRSCIEPAYKGSMYALRTHTIDGENIPAGL